MKWILLAALAACGRDPKTFDPTRAAGTFDAVALAGVPPGLSAMTLDDRGVPWTIAERDRVLVELTVGPGAPTTIGTKQYPIDGVPDGVDTESLQWLGPNRVAIGIEGQDTPRAAILTAERNGDRFTVTGTRELADLGVAMKKNHGAEGLCGADGDLLVAIEETGTLPDGGRYAPIVRLTGTAQSIYKLRLGTATGKISTLDCTIGNPITHVYAIERHYGVSRVVTFDVPATPTDKPLDETLVVDLAPILKDSLNLEGIVKLPDGRMLVISDNQGNSVSGPGYVLVFPAR